MGLFKVFKKKQRWKWAAKSGVPPPAVVDAMVRGIRTEPAFRNSILHQAVKLIHDYDEISSNGDEVASALCEGKILHAATEVLRLSDPLTEEELEAVLLLTEALSSSPHPSCHHALHTSAIIPTLLTLLAGGTSGVEGAEEAGAQLSARKESIAKVGDRKSRGRGLIEAELDLPAGARLEVMRSLRRMARRTAVREELKECEGVPLLVSAMEGAVQVADLALAGEAAWALEMLAVSRRLCHEIGEAGGVAAVVSLLSTVLSSRPTNSPTPCPHPRQRQQQQQQEGAAGAGAATTVAAVTAAVYALSVLVTDCRGNRVRLREVPGAGPLLVVALADPGNPDWESKEQVAGMLEDLASTLQLDGRSPQGSAHLEEWRTATVPALVRVLRQYRGLHPMQQTKEAVVGVLGKLAGGCEEGADMIGQSGALPPLRQLLHIGGQMAGRDRRLCCVVLRALRELAPVNSDALGQAQDPGSRHPQSLLDDLCQLMEEGTEGGDPLELAEGWGRDSAVQAGWLAAAVTARMCVGHQGNQDRAASCHTLRQLCIYIQAPLTLLKAPPQELVDTLMRIKCDIAEAFRSISLRTVHHAALRDAGVAQHAQRVLSAAGPTWTELRVAAKQILQNLGDIPDLDRPFLTYSADHLAHVFRGQGIEPARFLERGVGGSELVCMSDSEIRELALAAQHARVLRLLQAYSSFNEIDKGGARDGCLTYAKLVSYLSSRGFRRDEIVPLAERLVQFMDADHDDLISFPDFLRCYEEFRSQVLLDEQPPSKRRRTGLELQ